MSTQWIVGREPGAAYMSRDGFLIARYPGPGFMPENGEIVYLLWHKRMTAMGERAMRIVDRRTAQFSDNAARAAAVAELKERATQ